tara:strand:- start:42 stop:473 length:432 start_codon:yes stop_codon:yes gene_type:complete
MIKTFRGLLADEEQDTIRLGTNNGLTGYRIVKFEMMANTPGVVEIAHVIKIYTREQDTVDAVIDFDDQGLLAAGYLESHGAIQDANYNPNTIFEDKIVNQDIFITHKDVKTGEACNYYLELEQVKLELGEASVATLRDMRGTN